LQRVFICSCLAKRADLYILDEPSAYLDVKKRIKLAQLLRERAQGVDNEKPCPILVVEHDLAILDYLSDTVQLFYGVPHQFGIISRPLTTKKGINAYLTGFLKTENIEFREKEYTFKRSASGRTWSNAKIFARYGKISKTFESFRLSMNPGTIYASEILGVVGENGCGKSTFAKILAGELQPDSGSEFEGIQAIVSYKIFNVRPITAQLPFVLYLIENSFYSIELYLFWCPVEKLHRFLSEKGSFLRVYLRVQWFFHELLAFQ
ncbi:unnamed protein product, partial [marine sediment metagenome]